MVEDISYHKRIVEYFQSMSYSQKLRAIYIFSISLGFLIRLIVSINAWGIIHPDEIYQSLEMAHFIVYGTGHIPPEFQSSHSTWPSYAASRSWLFPMFFALFMYFGELVGLDYLTQTLVLIKIYLAIHSTLLIPAVYKLTNQISKDETTATIAAFMVAFWFRLIELTVRTFTNTFFLPMLFYGIFLILKNLEEDDLSINNLFQISFYVGLSTYIRIDLGIIVFSYFIVYFNQSHLISYLKIGLISGLFWIWGAWYDYNMYDGAQFFSVIINWFTFNIIEGHSAFFGVTGPFYYLGLLIARDMLFVYFLIMILWFLKHIIWKRENSVFNSEIGNTFKKSLLATGITWIIYSNFWLVPTSEGFGLMFPQTHKEIRFIMGGLVMFLISTAVICRMILSDLPARLAKVEKTKNDDFYTISPIISKYRRRVLLSVFILFVFFSGFGVYVSKPQDYYQGINHSLTYIGSVNSDPEAIYVGEHWFFTGWFTYSHVSGDTRFVFLPFADENFRSSSISTLSSAIASKIPDIYLVIPWYVELYFEDVIELLRFFQWDLVYQYEEDTYVWYSEM